MHVLHDFIFVLKNSACKTCEGTKYFTKPISEQPKQVFGSIFSWHTSELLVVGQNVNNYVICQSFS